MQDSCGQAAKQETGILRDGLLQVPKQLSGERF